MWYDEEGPVSYKRELDLKFNKIVIFFDVNKKF